jgi:PPIC-type PPIASE domain
MIRSLLSFTLAAAAAWGQTQGSVPAQSTATPQATPTQQATPTPQTVPPPQATPKPPAPAPPESAAKVAPSDPVITVHGLCSNTPPKRPAGAAAGKTAAKAPSASGPCETVITKAQFERLIETVNPNVPPTMRRNIAQAYVELMAFAQAAQKAGVENDPKFAEQLRLLRMQALVSIYRRNLEEKNRNPDPQEVQAYYKQNVGKYEEIKLSRIFIPAKNSSSANKDDWEKKAAQTANDIHDRATKGEDFDKLQKEAYTTLGLTIAPPNTTVGTRRRGMLTPAEEQELFGLKAGDVSKVEQEPAGYIIYKVESKQTLPQEQVKDEISRELFRQKMESQMKSITGGVKADFNDQYFGSPNSPPPGAIPPGAQAPGAPRPPVPAPASPPASTPPQGQAPPK